MQRTKTYPGWLGKLKQNPKTPALGKRELSILEALWNKQPLTAQQILELLPNDKIGLNTVQSTLERLYRKEMVSRSKQTRAYFYSPRVSRQDIISSLLNDITQDIAGGDMDALISGFKAYIDNELPNTNLSDQHHSAPTGEGKD